ncbi:oxidoreductase activity protein [[Candida] boidinii]|uniref:Unnamed protein product n=1 Tax=Candida boidinii TaxID=5477 RepID=A0ACB5TG00_CANBO|nr:oxidoreductase activity protein [[Candida] boidinii]OWB59527.1 oxidoreductase activity protein [[Candida] boidinii]OWB72861.1 oxidoreductase activity protein [[Candida] boidinii]OWB78578.1 oxidoreductase activity protein [[Candida] boidinii]GME87637.1 unnamed protein product [[Candida] boidinii]
MTKTFEENVAETSYILNDLSSLPRPNPQLAPNVMDLFSLKGKVAVVTGAGQGIGYCVIEAYAQAGADVALWDIYEPKEQAEKLAKLYGVKAKSYACDVTKKEQVEATVNQIEKDFGTIDVFVANAGINCNVGTILHPENADDKNWERVLNVNVNGVYYCAKNAGRIFKKNGKGSFVITGSMSGHIINTPIYQAGYNTSKAAVIHLAKSLAIEFTGFARVNSVSPGYVDSGINDHLPHSTRQRWWTTIPAGREGLVRELAGAYLYFASDASSYTTGADLVVDGGFTIC